MGKKIDLFVLSMGISTGFYLFFRGAFQSRMLCILLSLLGCAVAMRLLRAFSGLLSKSALIKKRRLRKQAGSAMMALACMDEAEAREKLCKLIQRVYGCDYPLELLQCHPAATLKENDVFDLWKRRKGENRIVLCTTARAEASCRSMAASLRQPQIALIDSEMLSQLVAESPEGMFPAEEKRLCRQNRLLRMRDQLFQRKNAPRCLLMFASMLMIYVFSANLVYLACALFLLFAAAVSLRRKGKPAKLF